MRCPKQERILVSLSTSVKTRAPLPPPSLTQAGGIDQNAVAAILKPVLYCPLTA